MITQELKESVPFLNQIISEIRATKNISDAELGKKVNMKPARIRQIENSQLAISWTIFVKLCKAFGRR